MNEHVTSIKKHETPFNVFKSVIFYLLKQSNLQSSFVSDKGLQTWRHFNVCEIVPKSCQFFDRASGVRIDACLALKNKNAKCYSCIECAIDIKKAFFHWGFQKASNMTICDQFRLAIWKHQRCAVSSDKKGWPSHCTPTGYKSSASNTAGSCNLLNTSSQILLINKGKLHGRETGLIVWIVNLQPQAVTTFLEILTVHVPTLPTLVVETTPLKNICSGQNGFKSSPSFGVKIPKKIFEVSTTQLTPTKTLKVR